MQRIGSPEDIADAVMLMLADESRFITGQKLVVDGGQYMWLAPAVPATDTPPLPAKHGQDPGHLR